MKKTTERFINCIPSILGMSFSLFGIWKDLFDSGIPERAIA